LTQGADTPSLDDASWQQGNAFTVTENGDYYAWAMDSVNGIISASTPVSVGNIDKDAPSAPTVTAQSHTAWTSDNITVEISSTDNGSGLSATPYIMKTSADKPSVKTSGWTAGPTFILPANGVYYFWACDNLGQISESLTVEIDFIITAPVWTVTAVSGEAEEETGVINLTAHAQSTHEDLGVKYYWASSSANPSHMNAAARTDLFQAAEEGSSSKIVEEGGFYYVCWAVHTFNGGEVGAVSAPKWVFVNENYEVEYADENTSNNLWLVIAAALAAVALALIIFVVLRKNRKNRKKRGQKNPAEKS
jgi:heme/copper-type cytochrome/quinol oxidase subunit 2